MRAAKLANYMEKSSLMWMMPLHLHINQNIFSDDDDEYPKM